MMQQPLLVECLFHCSLQRQAACATLERQMGVRVVSGRLAGKARENSGVGLAEVCGLRAQFCAHCALIWEFLTADA
jgi:hypothetical protein